MYIGQVCGIDDLIAQINLHSRCIATFTCKATPNWTLVSRPPFLENMMRAGGVFVLLYYCEYD